MFAFVSGTSIGLDSVHPSMPACVIPKCFEGWTTKFLGFKDVPHMFWILQRNVKCLGFLFTRMYQRLRFPKVSRFALKSFSASETNPETFGCAFSEVSWKFLVNLILFLSYSRFCKFYSCISLYVLSVTNVLQNGRFP